MSWWLRRVVDFLNWLASLAGRRGAGGARRRALAARLSGRKYEVLARRVPPPAPDGGRRFIAIQIDGLSHDHLLRALAMGQLPGIQRLLAEGYRLQRWRCGLPTATPSVQAGLMYGNNWDIPAFRWYEKDTGFAPTCRVPAHMARLKPRVAAGRPGILAGGCSYMNVWDGDARLALFTLSAMGRQRFFEHLRGLGWLLLFGLMPWRLLRIIGLTAWDLARLLARSWAAWVRSGFRRRPAVVKPVLETLANITMAEIQTFGVLLDVYRGMPAICVNFYGYDEVAHGDGPLGRDALRALRRIDKRIREIERVRRLYWPDMDLYIFSDHGLTPSMPFRSVVAGPGFPAPDGGQSLGEFIAKYVHASVAWDESPRAANAPGRPTDSAADGRLWLLDELDGIEAHLSPRGRRLLQALRRRLRERMPPDPALGWDLARSSDVVVRSSGSLAHIYFNVTRERMAVSEVAILYPDLVDALNDHPAIGLVLGMEGERPVAVTSRGTALLSSEWLPPGLAEPEQTVTDLARLLRFQHAGDLVLLGAWNRQSGPDGRVVAFEDHVATHGGIGGPQEYPFFITPPDAPLDLTGVTNAEQLYPYFLNRYHAQREA